MPVQACIVAVGIDVTPIDRMAQSLARFGDRFQTKVFTPQERTYCQARGLPAEHFAARFAAKEATLKALSVPPGLSWHELEVVVPPGGGAPALRLTGAAQAAMQRLGITRLHLSLTHAGGVAAAVVLATREPSPAAHASGAQAQEADPAAQAPRSAPMSVSLPLSPSSQTTASLRVITGSQMRALDEETIASRGIPGVVLMESAGRGVADVIRHVRPIQGRRVAVVCGPGNNGGDGYVVARHLWQHGAQVTLLRCAPEDSIKGDARIFYDAAQRFGIPIVDATPIGWQEAAPHIDAAEVLVDALLGTGITRPVSDRFAAVITRMNRAPGLRIAVDLPSGLHADTGQPLGFCVNADHTVTFAFAKLGLVTHPGFLHAGTLHIADIGIPDALAAEKGYGGWLLGQDCLAPLRKPRALDAHKGQFGHLLIVAGSATKTGAAWMCGEAASRTGCGLCTLAAPEEAQRALAGRVIETMTESLGPEPLDAEAAAARLTSLLQGKRAVAFGPGVGQAPALQKLLEHLLTQWDGPLVIDADGLNLLAQDTSLLKHTRAQVIVTPHPAEMARLLGTTDTQAVQADRAAAAERFAREHQVIVVLKGARSLIAGPHGELAINPTGNPGLAKGGSGDVLTGILAALCAQGLAPLQAAQAGTYLHGAAADLAAQTRGQAGLLARDVIKAIPQVLRAA